MLNKPISGALPYMPQAQCCNDTKKFALKRPMLQEIKGHDASIECIYMIHLIPSRKVVTVYCEQLMGSNVTCFNFYMHWASS